MIFEVYNTGKPVKKYSVNHVTVNNWVNKANCRIKKISENPLFKISNEDKKVVKNAEYGISRLKKENERIAMENEIKKNL
ncbi:transposase IS3/IS911 family protein [Clostridium paraputrificum]|nr:transposase IS3/IS911 family protein [Clostridium paraputrificum]